MSSQVSLAVVPAAESVPRATSLQGELLRESARVPSANLDQLVCRLPGALDETVLRAAVQALTERHAMLRAGFRPAEEGGGHWVQVHPSVPVSLCIEQLPAGSEAEFDNLLGIWLAADRSRGFDFEAAPLSRWALFVRPEGGACLVWTVHRAVVDTGSLVAAVGELFTAYAQLGACGEVSLPEPVDYTAHLRWSESQDPGPALAHFEQNLAGFTTTTQPALHPSSADEAPLTRHAEVRRSLSVEDTRELERLAQTSGVALRDIVQSAWALLLSQYCDTADVVFGVWCEGREGAVGEADRMLGPFVHALPVRARWDDATTLLDVWKTLHAQDRASLRHAHTPAQEIQRRTGVPADQPLMGTLFAFETQAVEARLRASVGEVAPGLGEVDFELLEENDFVLECTARHGGAAHGGLEISIAYDVERYGAVDAERMAEHVCRLLQAMLAGADQPLETLPTVTEAERAEIHRHLSPPPLAVPAAGALERFLEHARLRPDATAVRFRERSCSYGELEKASRRVASALRAAGVGVGDRVVLCMPRCMEAIEALLGILRSGAAYVPVDPEDPPARIRDVVRDSGARLVLTRSDVAPQLSGIEPPVYSMDGVWAAADEAPLDQPSADQAAYVIYTSGTTGKPKGVVVEHGQLGHHVSAVADLLGVQAGAVCLQFASFAFDVSVEETFVALAHGASLVVRSREMLSSASAFLDAVAREDIQVLNLPTGFFRELVHELKLTGSGLPGSVQTVIVGGERVPAADYDAFRDAVGPGVRFVNGYGPTETTVTSTALVLTGHEDAGFSTERGGVSIGRPLPGSPHRILDRRGRDVAPGVTGELYIGGPRVARGYFERPELTAERFVQLPGVGRAYRTGDLVRLDAEGRIHFVGRADHQVKVRGFRTELGEVEAGLRRHPSVVEAVALVDEAAGVLVGFVASAGANVEQAELREACREVLPGHMVPTRLFVLPQLPRNAAGKVDTAALRALNHVHAATDVHVEGELTGRAGEIAHIWSELLGLSRVGADDSFFELGGHSLLAVRMFSRVEALTGIRVDVREFFRDPTVRKLEELCAGHVEVAHRSSVPPPTSLDALGEAGGYEVATLVPLQSKGSGAPLYMMCGIELYRDLALQLGTDRPTYGLFLPFEARLAQADGQGEDEEFPRVEELAAGYVRGLRAHQPRGPYRVGGVSFGGVVAFEVAQQLRAAGEEVEVVLLVDSVLPSAWQFSRRRWAQQRVQEVLGDPRGAWERVSRKLRAKLSRSTPDGGRFYDALLEADRGMVRVLRGRAYHLASHQYEPHMAPYDGRVILIKAADLVHPVGYRVEPSYGWKAHVRGQLDIEVVPGDHLGVLKQPHVTRVADYVRPRLGKEPASFQALLEAHRL